MTILGTPLKQVDIYFPADPCWCHHKGETIQLAFSSQHCSRCHLDPPRSLVTKNAALPQTCKLVSGAVWPLIIKTPALLSVKHLTTSAWKSPNSLCSVSFCSRPEMLFERDTAQICIFSREAYAIFFCFTLEERRTVSNVRWLYETREALGLTMSI